MTNTKHKTHYDFQERITVLFGYGLFIIALITLGMSFIPWVIPFNDPGVLNVNIVAIMVALAAASILPPLAGYLIGSKATHKKSKLVHHYNGVLFGILGFWLTTIVSNVAVLFDFYSRIGFGEPYIWHSVFPVVISLGVLVAMGVAYARHTKHQTSLLNYAPYRVMSVLVLGLLFVLSGLSIVGGMSYGAEFWSSFAVLFLPVVMVATLVLFGAWVSGEKNGSWTTRILKSTIGVSYGFIATVFAAQALSFNAALASWSVVIGLAVYIAYIVILRKYPQQIK